MAISQSQGIVMRILPTPDFIPTITDSGIPGTVSLAWLNRIVTQESGETLLGYVELGTIQSDVELRVIGSSGNHFVGGKSLRFAHGSQVIHPR